MKLVIFFILLVVIFLIDANIPQLDGRIVGGEQICISEHPYQVSLRHQNSHICGASIIHQDYVLTATHCLIDDDYPGSYSIRAGSSHVSSGGVQIRICDIINHRWYSYRDMVNDISILKLCTPLNWSDKIKPVALAESSDTIAVGTLAVVSGWGFSRQNGEMSDALQRVIVPIINNDLCQSLYPDEIITDDVLCAGYVGKGKKDACQGDSGGPLYANGKQIGIVSWGYGCARKKYPGVYTNVAKYRDWIENITHI